MTLAGERGAPRVAISVVMCTHDRAVRLMATLESWDKVPRGSWELVVVVNASTDGSADVVRQFGQRTTVSLIVVEEPRAGVCAARNAGWRAARGAVVAFVDDDCYPAEDYVAQLEANFNDAALGFVGGRMVLFDPSDDPLATQAHEHRRVLPPRSVIAAGVIHGGNMAFRRSVLEVIGGFDVWLGAGTPVRAGGDSDALARASAAGFAGVYDPRVLVLHHHGRKAGDEVSTRRAYSCGRGAFHVKCLLDPRRRPLYARPILRHVRRSLKLGDFQALFDEVRGAGLYLMTRALGNVGASESRS